MSGRLWSKCLSVCMEKSQIILAWSFVTTLSGSTHQHLLSSRFYSAYMALYTIKATLLCLSVAGDVCQGFCLLFAQPASWVLHSVVDIVLHCPGVHGLLLSCHDQSLCVCSDVAFNEQVYVWAMSANSVTPLCQAPCKSFSYQAAASSGSFQVVMKRLHSATSVSVSAFLLT